uniref:Uncharacterized protein n=1 Tax=Ailuropoda melanoleuca TaxID=9646 RepID=A0A7N5K454_AILME
MQFTLFYKIMVRTPEFTYCFLFPSRKLIAYCMRKREPSDLKYILVMLLFHFCLHIFCLFLGLAI